MFPATRTEQRYSSISTFSTPVPPEDVAIAQCRVCGLGLMHYEFDKHLPHTWRCSKHVDKNPCAVDGCSRSKGAKGHLHNGDYWLCRDHWRMACPPGSKWRRTYLRFWKIAKKMGCGDDERWPEELERRFWRYFGGLVARARRMAAGDLDMAEINKLFGWD